jgi:hypothetical protein
MTDYIYKLRYVYDHENREQGYTKNDIENDNQGLCDSLILISIIKPEDGSYSQLILSHDGKENRELTDEELFKAWLMLAMKINERKKLKGWKKQLIHEVSMAIRKILTGK